MNKDINTMSTSTLPATNQAQSAQKPKQKRAYYLTFDQAMELFSAYTAYAHALSPNTDYSTKYFEVRLDSKRYIKFFLNGDIDAVGDIPNSPDCEFQVTGPYSRPHAYTTGPRGRTWADRFGMAVLYEITTIADKLDSGCKNYAAIAHGRTMAASTQRKAQAAHDLVTALDDFSTRYKLRTPVLELVTQRNLQRTR